MYYYLITNDIKSPTCADQPQWLKDKRQEYQWWKICTSPDMKKSIIASKYSIVILPEDRPDINKISEQAAQALENAWHHEHEIDDINEKNEIVKKLVKPIMLNKFTDKWDAISDRLKRLKEQTGG